MNEQNLLKIEAVRLMVEDCRNDVSNYYHEVYSSLNSALENMEEAVEKAKIAITLEED